MNEKPNHVAINSWDFEVIDALLESVKGYQNHVNHHDPVIIHLIKAGYISWGVNVAFIGGKCSKMHELQDEVRDEQDSLEDFPPQTRLPTHHKNAG